MHKKMFHLLYDYLQVQSGCIEHINTLKMTFYFEIRGSKSIYIKVITGNTYDIHSSEDFP